jgi:hypothetical protein
MADAPPQKRARTEDAEETTKNEPEYVYVVSRTTFNDDDYKSRGDDWPSLEACLGVFRTRESATRKMEDDQVDIIIEEFDSENHEELAEKYENSRISLGHIWGRTKVVYDREAILKDLASLEETVFAGEYVPLKYDWSLEKHEVQG